MISILITLIIGAIYNKLVQNNGQMDLIYASSIKKSPQWVVEKAGEKLKKCRTQTEVQELLVGVAVTPEGVNPEDNVSISRTKWRPTYISEEDIDRLIRKSSLSNDQILAIRKGYHELFTTLGNNRNNVKNKNE